MKKFLLIASACIVLQASAQIADVSSPQPLLRGVESEMYYPEFSADGRYLSFTDASHQNARIYDFTDKVTVRVDAETLNDKQVKVNKTVSATVENSELIIGINGVEYRYSPIEAFAGYLWPSVSPDGTKVMFVAAGKGIVITDLKGNIISRPGERGLEAPVWFGNNHIVAMNAKDDGHQYRSSQIVMLTVDGTQIQSLTKPESMTMFPTASPSADRVVYNTIDGRLYQIEVKLK